MKSIIALLFCLCSSYSYSITLSRLQPNLAKDTSAPKISPFGKEITISEEQAEEHLWRGQEQNKKARNALIFGILTIGIFYFLAVIWLVSAFSHTRKAYLYYKHFSKNKDKIKEAEKAYQTSVGILVANLVLLFALSLTLGVFDIFSISDPKTIGLLGLLTLFIADLLFFKTIFKKI